MQFRKESGDLEVQTKHKCAVAHAEIIPSYCVHFKGGGVHLCSMVSLLVSFRYTFLARSIPSYAPCQEYSRSVEVNCRGKEVYQVETSSSTRMASPKPRVHTAEHYTICYDTIFTCFGSWFSRGSTTNAITGENLWCCQVSICHPMWRFLGKMHFAAGPYQ